MDFDKQPMIDIWRANKEYCTTAAIISDGEVISGSMPSDDYKLAWLDADSWLKAITVLPEENRQSVLKTPKSWVKRIK